MNKPKAICYLTRVDDEQNKAELWDSTLEVTSKGKGHHFELLHVQNLSFNHRKPMFYLIGGGIVVPFTFLAFAEGYLDPYWAVGLLVAGLLSLYYGWMGYQVFTVHQVTHNRDFRLPYISSNMREFANFVVNRLPVNQQLVNEQHIYHICSVKTWNDNCKDGVYKKPTAEPFIHASSYHQIEGTLRKHFNKQKDLVLISIDPLKVHAEIRYEDLYQSGQLFPHIYGDLNLDAVKKMESIK